MEAAACELSFGSVSINHPDVCRVCRQLFSREVVTYGQQYLDVSEAPDWKPLHPTVKKDLVTEVCD